MSNNDLTGHTLGQYTITARLGRGGMADVYKAYHPKLEVYRAVKVIRPEFVTTSDFRERFQKEAQSVASLRHTNIVQIHDFGEQDDAYYMVMEFVEGQDLKRIIKSEGKIRPIRRPLELINQVADALHYAHSRGLIHRDIKPENIMINEDGLPILMDFGIAKLLTANTQLTQTGMGIGTPAYMAPEQAQALPEIGPTADIYSLSVVLYEMLTGQVPFSADTPMAVMLKAINDPTPMPRQFSGDISENLQQVLLKGMAKDPDNRYKTARQLQKALQEVIDEEPDAPAEPAATAVMQSGERDQADEAKAQTKASDKATKVRQDQRRGSRGLGMVVGLLALVAIAGAGGYYLWTQPGEPERLAAEPEPLSGDETESESIVSAPVSRAGEEADQIGAEEPDQGSAPEADTRVADAETDVAEPRSGDGPRSEAASEPRELDGGAVNFERYAEGRTSRAGQTVSYAFDADAGQTIYFDADDSNTEFTLTAPDDGPRVFRAQGDHGPITLEQEGTYTLEAEPLGDGAGEFEFIIHELDTPVLDGGAVALGEQTRGETRVAGQKVTYALDADSGQQLVFELSDSSETTEFSLTAPNGRTRVFQTTGNHGPVTLNESGTYALIADPRGDAVAEFGFVMRQWQPPTTDGGAIQTGRYVRDQFAIPGRAVAYTLNVSAGQTIFFDHVDNQRSASRIDFALTAPGSGSQVFQTRDDYGPVTLKEGGTYKLVVNPGDERVSGYEFVVWSLDPAVVNGGSLSLGQTVKGKTSKPGQSVAYQMFANAGQSVQFEHVKSTEATDFRLTAPDGETRVFETSGNHGPVTLDQSGTYTLVADPRDDWVSEFEFIVRPAGT